MRYPDFLKDGGRIGFIAPSFGCTLEPYRERFIRALSHFKEKGYETVLGPNCFRDDGVGISSTPENCALEVNEFFAGDDCDVIISCGGGELMCEILPFVDFRKLAVSRPKWFAGYSDNTNLTFLLNTLCDTASLYAPCASDYLFEEAPEYVNDAFAMLKGSKSKVHNYGGWFKRVFNAYTGCEREIAIPYRQYIYAGSKPQETAEFTGRLIGGCLDCLANLVGTAFDKTTDYIERYRDDGFIWFIESCDLSVMGIRRALWQMQQAGWFKYVKGFLIGRPYRFDDTFGDLDHYEAVLGILDKYKVPIIMDVDIGHLSPKMPVVSGACARVCARGNEFNMEYEFR